ITHWNIILALAIGGVIAAPLAAWSARHIPHKPFMVLVGLLIVTVNSLRIFKIL
ncbi:MAG: putative rane transporter protein, partial [Prosthecobacter sp.]|nr:putative rane transporter protein [Prosthecobacter sp.]